MLVLPLFLLPVVSLFAQKHDPASDSLNLSDALGRKQGTWRANYATGELSQETMYKDGKKNGLDLTFYHWPNCMKTETQYKNDTLTGYHIEYYRNCNIKLVENYVKGQLDGYVRTYDRNGILRTEGLYKNGKLEGFVKTYDKKGGEEKGNKELDTKINLEDYVTGVTPIKDSVILQGMSLAKPDKNTLIAVDVTGSMYPYAGQLLLWYKMNIDQYHVQDFVFFNDGDNRPDRTKKVGKVGGVYPIKVNDIMTLKNTVELGISKGNGGDMQENDIEGILGGLKEFRKVTKIILVADRLSPVRDMTLLKKVKAPVYVILCGSADFTNMHYLTMALKTGGAVYTLNGEWIDMKGIEEGQRLHIAHLTYEFRGGHFVRLKE